MKKSGGTNRQATIDQLEDTLLRLRDLIDRPLPELRLATGMTGASQEAEVTVSPAASRFASEPQV